MKFLPTLPKKFFVSMEMAEKDVAQSLGCLPEPKLGRRSFLCAAVAALAAQYFPEAKSSPGPVPAQPDTELKTWAYESDDLLMTGEIGAIYGMRIISSPLINYKPQENLTISKLGGMPIIIHSDWQQDLLTGA